VFFTLDHSDIITAWQARGASSKTQEPPAEASPMRLIDAWEGHADGRGKVKPVRVEKGEGFWWDRYH
jgi:hypothetical protein